MQQWRRNIALQVGNRKKVVPGYIDQGKNIVRHYLVLSVFFGGNVWGKGTDYYQ